MRLGFISFGGPAGQIAIMHREVVEQRRWLTAGQSVTGLALAAAAAAGLLLQ